MQSQPKKFNVKEPSIRFDHPLWFKALEIITAKELKVAPLLSDFDMLMSFCGSIGTIVSGSGIERVFQNIYGENAAKHILIGKAVSRANRAHIVTRSALMIILYEFSLAKDDSSVDLGDIKNLYERVISKDETCVFENNSLQNLSLLVEEGKTELRGQSHKPKLRLQYIDYVEICRLFIYALEQLTGNCIFLTSKMLNLFAATGHVHYVKCSRIYLQMKVNLEHTHPWFYQRFAVEGLFVVRRSERFWAGLWPDLTIEQIMMRALKSRGGLTLGSSFTESVRIL